MECLSSWLIAWLPDGNLIGRDCMDINTGQYISTRTHADVIKMAAKSQKYLLIRTGLNIFLKVGSSIANSFQSVL